MLACRSELETMLTTCHVRYLSCASARSFVSLHAPHQVRLELKFEFDGFGETCSHIWPEEPPKPLETEVCWVEELSRLRRI